MLRALFLSLVLHVVIVCLFLVGALMQIKHPIAKHIGNIKAYVYHEPALIECNNSKASVRSSLRPRKSDEKPRVSSDRHKLITRRKSTSLRNNGGQRSGHKKQLLIILHNKIQKAVDSNLQNIPSFFKGREVIVKFRFSDDGRISSIELLKRSNVAMLDAVIKRTLMTINLMYLAQQYLRHSVVMRVRIAIR